MQQRDLLHQVSAAAGTLQLEVGQEAVRIPVANTAAAEGEVEAWKVEHTAEAVAEHTEQEEVGLED